MGDEIQILIADDHPMMRKGLRLSIEEDPELKVVAEASDGEAAVALIESCARVSRCWISRCQSWMDWESRAPSPAMVLAPKSSFSPSTLTSTSFVRRWHLGSQGYILKDIAVQEIVAGVRAVAADRPYLSSAVTAYLLEKKRTPPPKSEQPRTSNLTPTERRIMQLIAKGKSSKEIGAELSIHYRTVENHRTNICRKLALEGEGANALLRFALQNKDLL